MWQDDESYILPVLLRFDGQPDVDEKVFETITSAFPFSSQMVSTRWSCILVRRITLCCHIMDFLKDYHTIVSNSFFFFKESMNFLLIHNNTICNSCIKYIVAIDFCWELFVRLISPLFIYTCRLLVMQGNILYRFPSLQRTASQKSKRKEYVGRRWADWVGIEKFFQEKKWQFRFFLFIFSDLVMIILVCLLKHNSRLVLSQ